MRRVATAREMREIDRRAIEEFGIPGMVLMENAGRGAAEIALEMLGDRRPACVAVVSGGGNNGGDGFVIARHLHNAGVDVTMWLLAERERISGDAAANLKIIEKMRLDIRAARPEQLTLGEVDLIVDAMLGTGLSGEVREPFASAIDAVNAAGKPVLAVDIPSGLNSDTGEILGRCIRATQTVTFALSKAGFTKNAGPQMTGPVTVVDIGIPLELLE